jgi:hypothetical protein
VLLTFIEELLRATGATAGWSSTSGSKDEASGICGNAGSVDLRLYGSACADGE